MSKIQRRCENWLKTYADWALPRCESPETFVLWSGIYTLAAATRRHVKIPKKLFGGWEASPNMYIIFVAPPGKARKSTTAGFAEDLLDEVTGVTKSPAIVTQAALLNQLVSSEDKSVYIISSEFASFINKSGVEMFEFLTDLFDGRKNIQSSTISRGVEFAERPCVNLLAATTPRWIAENMPESVIGGGFASRVIFIFEDKIRRRQLYYDNLDQDALSKLRSDLVADLKHIANNIKGDFTLDDDAKQFMKDWYDRTADNIPTENYRLFGYYERKPAHIHKVAMLLHMAYSDELVLHKHDFEAAIAQLEALEGRLPDAFKTIGKNEYAPDMDQIYEYIVEKGRVKKAELRREFFANAQPALLEELISGLIGMELIKVEVDKGDNGVYYLPVQV